MKILITESQLKEIIKVRSEKEDNSDIIKSSNNRLMMCD